MPVSVSAGSCPAASADAVADGSAIINSMLRH